MVTLNKDGFCIWLKGTLVRFIVGESAVYEKIGRRCVSGGYTSSSLFYLFLIKVFVKNEEMAFR